MSQVQNPSSLGTMPEMRVVEVSDKIALSQIIATELGKNGPIRLRASYSTPDAETTPEDQKENAKSISTRLVRRIEQLQPAYGWEIKARKNSPHTIRNLFSCTYDTQNALLVKKGTPCNGLLTIAVSRHKPGTKVVSVTVEHDHAHGPAGVAPPVKLPSQNANVSQATATKMTAPKVSKPTTQQSQQPRQIQQPQARKPQQVEKVISTPTPSVAKDILRAFGTRPRTPEFYISAKQSVPRAKPSAPPAPSVSSAPSVPAMPLPTMPALTKPNVQGMSGISTDSNMSFKPSLPAHLPAMPVMPTAPTMPVMPTAPTMPTVSMPVNSALESNLTSVNVAPKKRGRPLGSKKRKENSGQISGIEIGLDEKPEKKKSTAPKQPRRRGIWVRNDDPRFFSPPLFI